MLISIPNLVSRLAEERQRNSKQMILTSSKENFSHCDLKALRRFIIIRLGDYKQHRMRSSGQHKTNPDVLEWPTSFGFTLVWGALMDFLCFVTSCWSLVIVSLMISWLFRFIVLFNSTIGDLQSGIWREANSLVDPSLRKLVPNLLHLPYGFWWGTK